MSEEERTYLPRKPARLSTIRSLTADTENFVRIMCFVIESQPGTAIVQDIYDKVEDAKTIKVFVEGTLQVDTKYMLIGKVTEKSTNNGAELILNASIQYNIDKMDLSLYKQALDMEGAVLQAIDQ